MQSIRRALASILALFTVLLLSGTRARGDSRPAGGPIHPGKWVGFLQPEGTADALALTLDTFIVQPEDQTASPRLNLLFKIGLGGYGTSEYESELFADPQYDFEHGILTLDSPDNEMVVSAAVYAEPNEMKGEVYLRSAAIHAHLYLKFQTDEPDDNDPTEPVPPLVPGLAGQYEGLCGTERAVLQLEAAKGVTDETSSPATGLHFYAITGVVGVENGVCPAVGAAGRPRYCVDHAFSAGSYDLFLGKLYLSGMLETDTCTRERDEFACHVKLLPKDFHGGELVDADCRFHKTQSTVLPFRAAPRRYHVQATAEQLKPLPDPFPPANSELVNAANGTFQGYLHHEGQNRYQPLRLNVLATNSTVNPHNENNVYVSVSSVLSFGRTPAADFWAQQFDRRTLYVVPGYTLGSPDSDTFLQVRQWAKGYIAGDWYSMQFGKVGTFEVVKDATVPALPADAAVIPGIAGNLRGPGDRGNGSHDYWDLDLIVPRQPRGHDKATLLFQGNYRLHAGGVAWPTKKIVRGSYDLYSGALGWLVDDQSVGEAKLVSGLVDGAGGARLFWPNDRAWAVGVFEHTWEAYVKYTP